MSRKNRALTVALEKEKAEKARLEVQLKAARAGASGGGVGGGTHKPRTESQVEAACREVVAEAALAAEAARKECAEWRDKALRDAKSAERDAGRFATVKAENERFRAIIKREVGDEKVDFAKLEASLEAAGGWRGRAAEIARLKMKNKALKDAAEAYEDELARLRGSAEDGGVCSSGPTRDDPPLGGTGARARPGTAGLMTRETAREATARRSELESAAAEAAAARRDAEEAAGRAKAAAARRTALERDVRTLREKVEVLREKSANDDKLIDALKAEARKAAAARGDGGGGGGGAGNDAAARVLERRARKAEAKVAEQESLMLQLRAKIASLEEEGGGGDFAPRGGLLPGASTSAAAIAAAAAGAFAGGAASDAAQHEEDVAALIEHAEGLEREADKLKGKLETAERRVDALRDMLGAEQQKTHRLGVALEGGGRAAGGGVGEDAEDAAAMRARALRAEAELERVRAASKERLETMEREVELYLEMTQEMKKNAGAR